jgi:hypothetical protein
VIADDQLAEHRRALAHHAHADHRHAVGLEPAEFGAGEADLTRRAAVRPGDAAEQGGLTGAVTAQNADSRALVDLEVYAPQGLGRPVPGLQVPDLHSFGGHVVFAGLDAVTGAFEVSGPVLQLDDDAERPVAAQLVVVDGEGATRDTAEFEVQVRREVTARGDDDVEAGDGVAVGPMSG